MMLAFDQAALRAVVCTHTARKVSDMSSHLRPRAEFARRRIRRVRTAVIADCSPLVRPAGRVTLVGTTVVCLALTTASYSSSVRHTAHRRPPVHAATSDPGSGDDVRLAALASQ